MQMTLMSLNVTNIISENLIFRVECNKYNIRKFNLQGSAVNRSKYVKLINHKYRVGADLILHKFINLLKFTHDYKLKFENICQESSI